MRDLSRVLVSLTIGASLLAASPTAMAAPALDPREIDDDPPRDPSEAPLDTDSDEPPLDTDSDEPPLDTDSDEAPLDTDSDEPPLDTDSDEAPPPRLEDEFDTDDGAAIADSYDPTRDSPEAQTARRWLAAGIAGTITGAVLVGGATALAMTAPCDPLAGNNCFVEARDRAALTMGVPGGVLLLGGVAMTVLGGIQKRRITRGITASVMGSRDQFGVILFGRF